MEDTPVEVTQKYIEGINWPASKDEVLEAMKKNGAPEDVLEKLRAAEQDRLVAPSHLQNALR